MKTSEKENFFREPEIPLWIDTYDDLFSDFDPRSYSQKALSQDFLEEVKRASRDKSSKKISLIFLVPKNTRDKAKELLIKKRLKHHFRKHAERLKKEYRKVFKEGAFFLALGIIFMIITTLFLVKENRKYWMTFLSVFLEPGGWFLFWEGLYLMIFESRKKSPDLWFYRKMLRAEIYFRSY